MPVKISLKCNSASDTGAEEPPGSDEWRRKKCAEVEMSAQVAQSARD